MALTGHLAFQAPGWHWPLLLAPNLAWPMGRSIAMTDSNPLVSIVAKMMAWVVGHPVNLLGGWVALCWVFQPVAAVFVLRSYGARSFVAAAGVAALSLLCPAWLMRFSHVNLLGHFLLLAALGLAVRLVRGGRCWWAAFGVLLIAILVHPYLFVYGAVVLAAPVVLALLRDRSAAWRMAVRYACVCVAPVCILATLSGALGAKASGYGHYSMNLLSPFMPQLSGLFGAGLPVIDATGGQYEGFNYQGAGVLLVILVAACLAARRRVGERKAVLAVVLPLAALTALALSPRVYAGQWLMMKLPLWPWNHLAAAVQSSGRAFWVVGYAAMIGAVALLSVRLRPRALLGLLAVAVVLQVIDTAPMRVRAAGFFAGEGQAPPVFAMPEAARLLRVVPACDPDTFVADQLRLVAARQGMRLADMRMARQPDGFDCETALADGLETKLATGEMRFFLPAAVGALRQAALGDGLDCRREEAGVLCTRGVANPLPRIAAPMGSALPQLGDGPAAGLAPVLSFGWRMAGPVAWSEGPEATLLFRLKTHAYQRAFVLGLDLDGVASRAGGERVVSVSVDGGSAAAFTLPDLTRLHLQVTLPAQLDGAVARVVIGVRRPVDPGKRGLAAPVRRAGVRLYGLTLQQVGA